MHEMGTSVGGDHVGQHHQREQHSKERYVCPEINMEQCVVAHC